MPFLEKWKKEDTPIMFQLRSNDQKGDKNNLDLRRTEVHETRDLGKSYRHTLQVKAPIELEVQFGAFHFKVQTATLIIEFSTFAITVETARQDSAQPYCSLTRETHHIWNSKGSFQKPNGSIPPLPSIKKSILFRTAKEKD